MTTTLYLFTSAFRFSLTCIALPLYLSLYHRISLLLTLSFYLLFAPPLSIWPHFRYLSVPLVVTLSSSLLLHSLSLSVFFMSRLQRLGLRGLRLHRHRNLLRAISRAPGPVATLKSLLGLQTQTKRYRGLGEAHFRGLGVGGGLAQPLKGAGY
jgi:hypothetical protein